MARNYTPSCLNLKNWLTSKKHVLLELEKLVDIQKTRLDLLEEEATHFRQSYHNISKEYQRVKS